MRGVGFAEHLERFWADSAHEEIAPARAGVEQRLPGFRVRRIAPAQPRRPWVYATCGAAEAAGYGEDGAEYVLLAPAPDPALVEMLAAVAIVNADAHPGLGVGSLLALGRPWTAASPADHLLVLPPYPFGPGFEVFEDEESERRVVVLWLVPITGAEAQFVRAEGCEAFEELLEGSGADVVDPARAPIVVRQHPLGDPRAER